MKRGGGQRRGASSARPADGRGPSPLTFKGIFLFLFVLLPLFSFGGAAVAAPPPVPPRPAKYVTDNAGALSAPAASALNEKLAAFERETSNQVLIFVDRKVPAGTTLEEFANRSFHEWGVGQKGKSNGVVFFLFTEDRKMRLEVGYGLEGALPDARAHRIDAEIVAPLLRSGDTARALNALADAVFAAARGEPYTGTGRTAAEGGRRNPNALVFFLPLLVPFLAFGVVLVVWAIARRRGTGGFRGSPGSVFSSSGSSWSSSSSSDSSSSSSDFSGGGGDSGGGGSSDSY
jgi:uncharacterized protein